jgi:hypothetical protein
VFGEREEPVSYEVSLEEKVGYLHAIVTGVNSRENVMRYLEDIAHECAARHCRRVLIEERLEGPRLGTMDVFEVASTGQDRAAAQLPTIAYVDENATPDSMKFAENVATNRGIYVRVFSTVADATQWLSDLGNPATEPHAPADADKSRR